MVSDAQVVALSQALHRKLCNYGHDIRACRKKPSHAQGEDELENLKQRRALVDKTYSACVSNEKESDPFRKRKTYDAHLALYQSL